MTPPDEFPGLTATDCCTACNQTDGCIISGMNCCLHPRKSGLQPIHQTMPDVLRRYERARKRLKIKDALAQIETGSTSMVSVPIPARAI
jgi:hypothetical protein